LLQIPASHFFGVGHILTGVSSQVRGLRYNLQSTVGTTVQTYGLVLRRDVAGRPDCGTPILALSPLITPVGGGGAVSWRISTTFATPLAVPQCDTLYAGIALPIMVPPAGLFAHMALLRPFSTSPAASNAGLAAADLQWDCVAGVAMQHPAKNTLVVGLLVDSPVLNMGNVDSASTNCIAPTTPDFGGGGLWPVCSLGRNDALHARVRDAIAPGAPFVVYMNPTRLCPSLLTWPLVSGAWYLSPGFGGFVIGSGVLGTTGEGVVPTILTPPVVALNCAILSVPWYYQAVTLGAPFRATNMTATLFGPP
jgi:hypothetical protein